MASGKLVWRIGGVQSTARQGKVFTSDLIEFSRSDVGCIVVEEYKAVRLVLLSPVVVVDRGA